ncbi:hypothetical protein F0A16_20555 [Salinicola corii]|uniref:Helix-turn-helix domain-containing protein n=1 Tax=Salinicola corii TaxID=2606937 RepID=A0A640W966_9GAMM|nr:hypothetical protein [Salinicola corii]KAA0015482.1 hypothetical protein F0A16_20555 [Salinicola corii]
MTFNDWVDDVGGIKPAADLLGEKPRSVRSWYHAERAPRQRSAKNIIEKSGYRVDWSGIYQPIETARVKAEAPA